MFTKLRPFLIVFFISIGTLFSQQEKGIYGIENWLSIWTDFNPGATTYKTPTQILSGTITEDTKLLKRETYLLLGNVFVADSTSLTIEPGTVILGDFKSKGSLIISNGSKIIAEGTQTDPIIFSSSRGIKKKGDWGGIFILGNAPVNKIDDELVLDYGLKPSSTELVRYGGNDVESNSGILKYVRIEYAGMRTKDFGYFNGLTLAGVGSETRVENVMVTYCQGSAYQILGGNTYLSQLVSFRTRINDLVLNYGAHASINNSLIVRSPYFTQAGGASSIYLATYANIEEADPSKENTHLNAENLTLLTLSDDLKADIKIGLVSEAMHVKEGASFSINKSIFSGFNPAVVLDKSITINAANLDIMEFSNMYFNNCNGNIFTEGYSNNEDLENWYGNNIFRNVYSKGSDSETFIDTKNLKEPDFRLRINRIIASSLLDDE
ncbi:hypothetical protein [Ulvibacter antarcticus]|uniref:Uncharacterized protein n=1 Tax=Ulvibacter antarcticus TaxID=442714 RepID=A0A3L9YV14_9FLAO|nr:hypothetical protein [Ulvibacter antarcticus]RMA64363.1 hypothetical protein BXY75_1238 [Ulvibacter antarcticus]